MAALTNPFDVLPANLFNLLGSQVGELQAHYMAILLRIYEMAEFNRFGLTRDMVIAEIVDYLSGDGAESIDALSDTAGNLAQSQTVERDDDADGTEKVDLPPADDVQEYGSWILRRLVDAGWLEREQQVDYTEFIILPDYVFTLLEAFRSIQEQKPREYAGQLYTAHQLLTNETDDFSPALALTQAYENVRQVVRGLNELNQNIRRYTDRVTRERPVAELLRLQYDDYAQALGPAYHALKTSDHISRYRTTRGSMTLPMNWLPKAVSPLLRPPARSTTMCVSSPISWRASIHCCVRSTAATPSICAPHCARFAIN